MSGVDAAIAFVEKCGSELERAHLRYLRTGEVPSSAITDKLFANQRDDGGFAPFWARNYSSLDATCFRLSQAEQMGIPGSARQVQKALDFFDSRQKVDGSFQENDEHGLKTPPWITPGDNAATLYLTANCGFWLSVYGSARESARPAATYLQDHLDGTGKLPSFLHTNWLGGGLWYRLGKAGSAERIFGYLLSRLEDMSAGNLAWLGVSLRVAGVPDSHPLLNEARRRLEALQLEDGSWPDDEGQAVHVTLEALRVLQTATG